MRELVEPRPGSTSIRPSASALRSSIVGRSDSNAVRPCLVRQRDGDLGAAGERAEQLPLGAGQILEAVREHRLAVPGLEVRLEPLDGVPAQRVAVPAAEPVELRAVGGEETTEVALERLRLERARTRAPRRSSRASRRSRRSARSARARSATRRRRCGGRAGCAERRGMTGRASPPPRAIRPKTSSNVPIEPPSSAPLRASRSRSTRSTSDRFGTMRIGPRVRERPDTAPAEARLCPRWQARR